MHNAMRALSVSLILILSSLAGCLADDEIVTSDIELEDGNYGTVMVSTYHVGQLVSAVAGDSVTIEYMSQDNIPVHDYEPSASDLIRLQQADLFFYHGLNLEPWVESTLSSLGSDAPPSYMTHAMPTGESALDYESMLVSNLCEYMSEGPHESTTLVMAEGVLPELHADNVAHNLSFPEVMDDDHDEDDHSEDDHGEDVHDEDDHDGHNVAESEKIIENAESCPANTVISIFHLEEGEHTLEFISEDGVSFDMVALKMGGGHAHQDHDGHDDHDGHEIDIAGEWIDEWGSNQTIDSDSWNSDTITQFDNDDMWAVAENGEDSFSPGLWSKYDWTWSSEELYYCQSTFSAETEADALSADSANATNLDARCGGFPWSLMNHSDDTDSHDDHDDDHGDDHDDGHRNRDEPEQSPLVDGFVFQYCFH